MLFPVAIRSLFPVGGMLAGAMRLERALDGGELGKGLLFLGRDKGRRRGEAGDGGGGERRPGMLPGPQSWVGGAGEVLAHLGQSAGDSRLGAGGLLGEVLRLAELLGGLVRRRRVARVTPPGRVA
ncbi:MAG: hypothetical protein JWL69_3916 [Phycisphaerales bacterium]|nr:hypothetical protein [Phycisphaerales bacterium]